MKSSPHDGLWESWTEKGFFWIWKIDNASSHWIIIENNISVFPLRLSEEWVIACLQMGGYCCSSQGSNLRWIPTFNGVMSQKLALLEAAQSKLYVVNWVSVSGRCCLRTWERKSPLLPSEMLFFSSWVDKPWIRITGKLVSANMWMIFLFFCGT